MNGSVREAKEVYESMPKHLQATLLTVIKDDHSFKTGKFKEAILKTPNTFIGNPINKSFNQYVKSAQQKKKRMML